jgi:quercetin dioxygenase-like cupin family protein
MFPSSQAKKKKLWLLGDVYTVKISGDKTQGRYAIWEIEVAPQNGPPPHKHSQEDEGFYVLEGSFAFQYGNSEIRVGKGQFAYLPRGEFHTYKNIDNSVGKLLAVITPSEFEKFFEEIAIPIYDESSFNPPEVTAADIEKVISTARKYGLDFKI